MSPTGKSENKNIEAGRPPGFVYLRPPRTSYREVDRVLHCEQVSLSKLAEQYGTPLYVYSTATIRERYTTFERAFRGIPHTVCYSVKANSNLSILRLLAKTGCGFDVVSGGELERVLVADRKAAKRAVFSGVGKTPEEMNAALNAGILLFNIESEAEMSVLAECAGRLRKAAPIALRVNPDVAAETHPYISTGLHKHKFGVPIGEARSLYAKAVKTSHLKVTGVSAHIGSQITDVSPFTQAMSRIADLVLELRRDGHQITHVDAGGGLGIDYKKSDRKEFNRVVAAYAKAVSGPLRTLKIHLLLEPGRSIIGPAGALITRVQYRKKNNSKLFLVTDAAMNDLIRPALYGAHHEIVPVVMPPKAEKGSETVDVVGPVCETGDFFARDREMPYTQEGDLLAILDAGAYGMALASNYNTRPRPAEVLVTGKSTKVIRRRETFADLIHTEM
jgi:diaminopimelate decarboxylase